MAKKKLKRKASKNEPEKRKNHWANWMRYGSAAVVVAILLFLIFNNFMCSESEDVVYHTFKKEGELTITDSTGKELVTIDIEIADNDYERQLGLMNRKSMEENQGMLFIFPVEKYQSFWMLNTLFSLDMLFINKEKEIVTIHKFTKPISKESYPSSKPAIYVLEVLAGFTDKYNIKEGDKIYWIGTKIDL